MLEYCNTATAVVYRNILKARSISSDEVRVLLLLRAVLFVFAVAALDADEKKSSTASNPNSSRSFSGTCKPVWLVPRSISMLHKTKACSILNAPAFIAYRCQISIIVALPAAARGIGWRRHGRRDCNCSFNAV